MGFANGPAYGRTVGSTHPTNPFLGIARLGLRQRLRGSSIAPDWTCVTNSGRTSRALTQPFNGFKTDNCNAATEKAVNALDWGCKMAGMLDDILSANAANSGLMGGLPASWQYQQPPAPQGPAPIQLDAWGVPQSIPGISGPPADPFGPVPVIPPAPQGPAPIQLDAWGMPQSIPGISGPPADPFSPVPVIPPVPPPSVFGPVPQIGAPSSVAGIGATPSAPGPIAGTSTPPAPLPPAPTPPPAATPPRPGPINMMPIGSGPGAYQMPQFGTAADYTPAKAQGALPAAQPQPAPGFGDHLVAGLQSFAHSNGLVPALANGVTSLITGHRTDPQGIAAENFRAQYDVLVPLLGKQRAMLALAYPEVGKTLINQALAAHALRNGVPEADSAAASNTPEQPQQPINPTDRRASAGAAATAGAARPGRPQAAPLSPAPSTANPPPQSTAVPPQNQTARVLRMRGVPEATIAAAIKNPELMRKLTNQVLRPGAAGGRAGR
jgi:hypothetical protein